MGIQTESDNEVAVLSVFGALFFLIAKLSFK